MQINEKEAGEGPFKKHLVNCIFQLLVFPGSVTRLGDLFDFGQVFKAFGNN